MKLRDSNGHHLLGPSAAPRWMNCPGSVMATKDIPNVDTQHSLEGTTAHELAEKALNAGVPCSEIEGYSEEMAAQVQKYVDYVLRVVGDNRMWVEQRIDLTDFIPGGYGTADVIAIVEDTLHVIDLKYGMNKVYANSEQLWMYGLGAHQRVKGKVRKIVLHIGQPRLGHFDTHELLPYELEAFGEKVRVAAELCLTDDAPLNPSEKACQWCRAKADCPALYEHNLEIIGREFDPIPAQQLTDEQLRLVVDNKGLIEKWLKSVEAVVFERLERGEPFEGWKMVSGRSQRKWADNAEEVLVKMLGDNAYEQKLVGITTAEKMIGKKQFNELGLTVKPAGRPVLAPESDKRKAISFSDDFENLEN